MAFALEQFIQHLTDSGVLSAGKLENFIPPKASPKDAQELANELVKQRQLTGYQASEVFQGRAKSLILGNYTIVDKLGAGGMGEVFKAEHRRMHRIVAIKVLPQSVTKDAPAVARFQREVEAAAKLSHPHIVTAHDADEAGGINFLVMEFVDGIDLSALVKKEGPLALDKALCYVLQAARGLEFAHSEGVIHRDIKPANLLLDKKGNIKILDMGLARLEPHDGDAATQAELTGTGAVMGTVDYMSPEQAFNSKHADARADIYSLGCTLYYLLFGKPTYAGETIIEKILAHREKPIPSLSDRQADVPKQLDNVFRRMVAKHPQDRHPSMSQVVTDLEECAAAATLVRNTQTTPDSPLEHSNLSFLAQSPAETHQHEPTKRAKQPRPAKRDAESTKAFRRRNRRKLLVGGGLLAGLILIAGVLVKLRTKDGMLVVEINQSDVVVQVLNDEGKVEITRPGEKGSIAFSVDPGKHRLKVEKDGFLFFAQDFLMESGGQQSIKATLEPVAKNTPREDAGFQQWMREVAALPAEMQAEAVAKKLQDLNPGFDGKFMGFDAIGAPKIDEGAVTELRFVTDDVTDISPVQALKGLQSLDCSGSGVGKGRLTDLSELRGMRLTKLNCGNLPFLTDLSPLQGMPLTLLKCGETQVASVSALKGMPLTTLWLGKTQVSDLSPLQGMPLTSIRCQMTRVSDLSPVAGMNLAEVALTPKNITRGMDVIRQMKSLKNIDAGGGEKDNFSPEVFWKKFDADEFGKPIASFNDPDFQQWMKAVAALSADRQVEAVVKKLRQLNPGFDGKETHQIEGGAVIDLQFFANEVTDISPVRALPQLTSLSCRGTAPRMGRLADLSPLRGMRVTKLHCYYTLVSDLSPLEGMPLTSLDVGESTIADLRPLKGMPLSFLCCNRTRVVDLSLLQGMPLKVLNCDGTGVSDLSPLEGMTLTKIFLTPTNITKGLDIVRKMNSLVEIGANGGSSFPAADFWKKYDAGQFGKRIDTFNKPAFKQWMKDIAALPAEKQVDAVIKKMQELTPGFDGNETHKIVNGVVTELDFVTDNVADISPVRALTGLKKLHCNGPFGGKGWLSDLSPLGGMQLTILSCADTHVCDLSPLTGMPLTHLHVYSTSVSDLAPLKGMPLTELQVANTRVADLSPLKGMPLTKLNCQNAQVSDLSPLHGMALQWLNCATMPISDLSALRGMPLTSLACDQTKVSDLSPVKGMRLKNLHFSSTPVSDLMPLKGMPLSGSLHCDRSAVTDLSPLQGAMLTHINLTPTNITKGIEVIRQMKSLDTIGINSADWRDSFPRDVFWKKYDAGEFGKSTTAFNDPAFQQWMKDVASRPAEQQVEAVVKKLQELNTGFDGKETHFIRDGVVTELQFVTDSITDLSPVRALVGLKTLDCNATGTDISRLSDLTPLEGMQLTKLHCGNTQVLDLSPLKAMPLTELWAAYTRVSDLTPLQTMPLTSVCCFHTQVSDLSPLKGMALTNLQCNKTQVSDLSPLKGMPLTVLAVQETQVANLSPIRGLPLTSLRCETTPISDLSPIEGMKLAELVLTPKRVTKGMDILRAMKSLQIIGVPYLEHLPRDEFWKKYDVGEFGKPITTYNDPAFQQWIEGIGLLRADEQVEGVVKKLQDLNPGFDGKETHKIVDGLVTEFGVLTDHVADISPVRAWQRLKILNCGGNATASGWISDLSPLKGMSLTKLICSNTQVFDLSPLKGMALTDLNCADTEVADLSPLERMPLEKLNCNFTQIFDLRPLEGMKLSSLECDSTKVSDLSPLKGMPLTSLNCPGTNISDLSPLTGMPLGNLIFRDTKVSDLSPLQGMPIGWLDCARTQVADPSPLRETPLWFFNCSGTRISDLSVLKDMPLRDLWCESSQVSDLSPLQTMKLTHIVLTPKSITHGMDVIRQMPSLKNIDIGRTEKDKFPPDVFWKKYDAGEFGK